MSRRGWWYIGLLAGLLSGGSARAQGPPILTDTPIMLGLQGRGLRTFVKIIHRGRLLQDGREIHDASDRTLTVRVTPLVMPYNLFSDRFQLNFRS